MALILCSMVFAQYKKIAVLCQEGQTIIIVQNYHPQDQAEDGGSTGERSEGESGGDLANVVSTADGGGGLIWEQPGRPFRMLSGGLHTNGVTLLVQANDVAAMTASSSLPEGCGGGGISLSDQKHSSGETFEPCPICGDKVSGKTCGFHRRCTYSRNYEIYFSLIVIKYLFSATSNQRCSGPGSVSSLTKMNVFRHLQN